MLRPFKNPDLMKLLEGIVLVSSLFWAIEAHSNHQGLAKYGITSPRLLGELARYPASLQTPTRKLDLSKNLQPLMNRPSWIAPQSLSSGNALSASFRENPFYSPTHLVLVRFKIK